MNKPLALPTLVTQIRSFSRPAKLFLLATGIHGIIFSAWSLFFNFYILERGFDREFLGLVTATTSAATLLLGIPLGMLSDRIGRKRAMLLGVGIYILATVLEITLLEPPLILVMAFIGGSASSLYYLSQAPFMMRVSTPEQRTLLFSLNFGLVTLAGTIGNLFAGQLPAYFGRLLDVPASSASAYQAVMLSAILTGSLMLIPLALMHEPEKASIAQRQTGSSAKPLWHTIFAPLTIQLALPNIAVGFGAAILIPYINVFLKERFAISDPLLGLLFSLSALLTGVGVILGPRLADYLRSKIRAITLTQTLSLGFLLLLGFSPFLWPAAIGFLMRATLMNMAVPLFDAFSMEQVHEREQATVNSTRILGWQIGWTIGPYISGLVQEAYGFEPLFVTTALVYALATWMTWSFFHRRESISAPQLAI
jgi:MFS family permease